MSIIAREENQDGRNPNGRQEFSAFNVNYQVKTRQLYEQIEWIEFKFLLK